MRETYRGRGRGCGSPSTWVPGFDILVLILAAGLASPLAEIDHHGVRTAPWPAKPTGLCTGAALMLLAHYVEWVVIPERKNRAMLRDKRPHQSPSTVEDGPARPDRSAEARSSR